MPDTIDAVNRALDPESAKKFGDGGRVQWGEYLPEKPGKFEAGFRGPDGTFFPVAFVALTRDHFAGGRKPVLQVRVSAAVREPPPVEDARAVEG